MSVEPPEAANPLAPADRASDARTPVPVVIRDRPRFGSRPLANLEHQLATVELGLDDLEVQRATGTPPRLPVHRPSPVRVRPVREPTAVVVPLPPPRLPSGVYNHPPTIGQSFLAQHAPQRGRRRWVVLGSVAAAALAIAVVTSGSPRRPLGSDIASQSEAQAATASPSPPAAQAAAKPADPPASQASVAAPPQSTGAASPGAEKLATGASSAPAAPALARPVRKAAAPKLTATSVARTAKPTKAITAKPRPVAAATKSPGSVAAKPAIKPTAKPKLKAKPTTVAPRPAL